MFKKINLILIYLILFLLPTQLGWHYFDKNLFVRGLRLDYLSYVVYLQDLLILLLLGINIRQINFKFHKILWFFLYFFALIFLIRMPINEIYFNLFYLFKLIIYYYFIKIIIETTLNKKILLYIFILQLFFIFGFVLLQVIFQHSIGGWLYYLGERNISINTINSAREIILGKIYLRPYATFSHPNTLAGYIVLLSIFLFEQFKLDKKVFFLILFFSISIILLSFSHLAIFSMFFYLILRFFIKKNIISHLKLKYLLIFIILSPSLLILLQKLQIFNSESLLIRNQIFVNFMKNNKLAIVFGGGFSGYWQQWFNLINKNLDIKLLQPVHNSLYHLLSIFGVLGLGLVAWALNNFYVKNNYFLLILSFFIAFDHFLITQIQTFLLILILTSLYITFENKKM